MKILLSRLMALMLLGGLAACGSAPSREASGEPSAAFNPSTDPYWMNPRWDEALLDAVQSATHDPVDPTDASTPGLHATVKFTYLAGNIEYPGIVQSTGDAQKDDLLLHQLASAQVPQAAGIDADKPHEFVLDVEMLTPFESFQDRVMAAIDYAKVYPKEAIISGETGDTVVAFDYLDGKVNGIKTIQSSKVKELDKASIRAVTLATMPPSPPAYAGKLIHMEVNVCFTLFKSPPDKTVNTCPPGHNVVVVQGWRIRRTG